MINIRTYKKVANDILGKTFGNEEDFVYEIETKFENQDDYIWIEETEMDGLYNVYSNNENDKHIMIVTVDYDYTVIDVQICKR